MKTELYNQEGNIIGEIDLPEKIFGVKLNSDFLYQVYTSLISNKRQPWAHSKDRAEVRGGGKKPWRQKGTGRARHGSIRSPLWKGGGATFGPRNEKDYNKKINKKAYRLAIYMVLADKLRTKEMKIIDTLNLADTKTKAMNQIMKNIITVEKNKKMPSTLLLIEKNNDLFRAGKNISYLQVLSANNVDLLSLLKTKNLILTKPAVSILETTNA